MYPVEETFQPANRSRGGASAQRLANDVRLFTYDLGLIFIDPYRGIIRREGKSSDFSPSFIEWLFQFHFSFQLGVPGAALTAA